jgi:hypothetical protein
VRQQQQALQLEEQLPSLALQLGLEQRVIPEGYLQLQKEPQ